MSKFAVYLELKVSLVVDRDRAESNRAQDKLGDGKNNRCAQSKKLQGMGICPIVVFSHPAGDCGGGFLTEITFQFERHAELNEPVS